MPTAPRLNIEDWQHLDQTVKMLYLAIAQIDSALHEGDHDAANIGSVFSTIHQQVNAMRNGEADINVASDNISHQVQQAIVAFQFYDRLSQRIDHVQLGLRKLVDIISDQDAIHNVQEWENSQVEIKASYTMETERMMFDKIMQGLPLEEVLQIFRHNFNNTQEGIEEESGDIIELF